MRIKINAILISTCVLLSWSEGSYADNAEVIFKTSGCDYFVADGTRGYYVLEWYGGYDPDKGDKLIGAIGGYGFKDIFYKGHGEGRVWVEDYLLSKESALEKMMEECS